MFLLQLLTSLLRCCHSILYNSKPQTNILINTITREMEETQLISQGIEDGGKFGLWSSELLPFRREKGGVVSSPRKHHLNNCIPDRGIRKCG